jgi:integrase
MENMPHPRPPHLQRHITRHGKAVWYVRIGKGPRTRIRAKFGTAEFDCEYQSAVFGAPRAHKGAPVTGSMAWLIARYREVSAWTSLSLATRKQRENIFKHVLDSAGHEPVTRITRKAVVTGCERRSKTPAQARHFLNTMRGLFRWALKAGLVKVDPTIGIERPRLKKSQGFIPWSEDDVSAYERRWPIGTRQRVWLDVLLYTGLRRGDAVVLGRQHVCNGVATLRTEKSQGEVTVTLPILSVLQRTLDAGPTGELAFICGATGKPFTKEGFGNEFREACRAAGVHGSAHGVRKIAATRAANAGATVAQLEAIFGWSGGRMASLYTQSADRKRLALDAMSKLANE